MCIRDSLLGVLVAHGDLHGWCFVGHEKLAQGFCGRIDKNALKMVGDVMRELKSMGAVGSIDFHERSAAKLSLTGMGAPENPHKRFKATLYFVRPMASIEGRVCYEAAERKLGRLPPARASLLPWATPSRGEQEPLYLAQDIIAMIHARELGADDTVRARGMKDPVRVVDVPEFAAAIPPLPRYFLSPDALTGDTEQELAGHVLAHRICDSRRTAWDEAGTPITLGSLPQVAAAFRAVALKATG